MIEARFQNAVGATIRRLRSEYVGKWSRRKRYSGNILVSGSVMKVNESPSPVIILKLKMGHPQSTGA